jgi:regulation of enolase protein 1 (concanavalin A-like superfamily)
MGVDAGSVVLYFQSGIIIIMDQTEWLSKFYSSGAQNGCLTTVLSS